MQAAHPDLAYVESGSGPGLVLLHAFPLNATVWQPLQAKLSSHYRVIAVDLPGFGRSQPPRPFTLDSAADELHALLTKLNALPCTLLGMSLGGYAAFAFIERHPQDLSKLVLVDTSAAGDTPDGKIKRNAMTETARRDGASAVARQMLPRLLAESTRQQQPALVRQLTAIMDRTPPQAMEYGLTAMRDRPDRSFVFAKINVPTLIIAGEHDAVAPPAVAEAMHRQIAGSQLAIIPGAGHVSALEQPAEFERVLLPFLRA